MSDRYALDDAAAAALWPLRLMKHERLGALYADDNRIARTDTIGGGDTRVGGTLSIPAGSLQGLFHNHPRHGAGDNKQNEFSTTDVTKARKLGVPSYISAGHQVMRFDPATSQTSEVLAQFPIDEFKRQLLAKGLLK